MLKIKDNLFRKLFKYDFTKLELTTMLELIQACDEKGRVSIYYKDIVDNLGCSIAQFYNVLNSLCDLGMIEKKKDEELKSEISILIKDNDFTEDYSKYIYIDSVFFYEKLYKHLRAGELRVFLYFYFRLMKSGFKGKTDNPIKEKHKFFYKKNHSYVCIAKALCLYTEKGKPNIRMVKEYCQCLKKEKYIYIKDEVDKNGDKYSVITLVLNIIKDAVHNVTTNGHVVPIKLKQKHIHYKTYIKSLCRRKKINYSMQNLEDASELMNQYEKQAIEKNKNIYRIMNNAIKQIKDNVLSSKTIHYIMRVLLQKNYDESIVVYY